MAESKCPVCGNMAEIKKEKIVDWIKRWDEAQWSSKEWRAYLLDIIRNSDIAQEKLSKIEPLYEEQEKYIKYLERQLELLQKTLDVVEKLTPRPIILSERSEVIK